MRLSVNYDVTFLAILLQGLRREEPPQEKRACVLNPFRKKCVVGTSPLLKDMAFLNTLLVDFKCRDDIEDGGRKGRKSLRHMMKRRSKEARKALPQVAAILDRAFAEQCAVERNNTANWHVAADPFAEAMKEVFRVMAGDLYTPEVGMIGYHLGQYVYLMDAIDDYNDDRKKKQYNPLLLLYGSESKQTLVQSHGDELRAEVEQLLMLVKENYRRVAIFSTEGIVTNTLWMGLRARFNEVIKENKPCLKTHTKF